DDRDRPRPFPPACAGRDLWPPSLCVQGAWVRRGDRTRQRHAVRLDRRRVLALARPSRIRPTRISRRQPLSESRRHWGGRRTPAFRRAQALGGGLEGGGAGLSEAIPRIENGG